MCRPCARKWFDFGGYFGTGRKDYVVLQWVNFFTGTPGENRITFDHYFGGETDDKYLILEDKWRWLGRCLARK